MAPQKERKKESHPRQGPTENGRRRRGREARAKENERPAWEKKRKEDVFFFSPYIELEETREEVYDTKEEEGQKKK